jgi:hypothetical protein
MFRFLSICLDASIEQFLANGDSIDYFPLIFLIANHSIFYVELIFQKLKDCMISKQELHACVILNSLTEMHSNLSKEEFVEYTRNGFVDYILKVIKLDSLKSLRLIFIFGSICFFLPELGMTKEMNLILQEMIDSLKEEDPNIDEFESNINQIFDFIAQISELNYKIEINFKDFLEFILERHEHHFFNFAKLLVFYRFVDEECKELFPKVFKKMFEILSDDVKVKEMNNLYQNLGDIVELMQFDFYPYISQTIKSSVFHIRNNTNGTSSGAFLFLIRLVEVFGEETEIFISKYNLVPLTIQIMSKINMGNNLFKDEIYYPTRFLLSMGFYRFKLLEMHILSILKVSNKLNSKDKM